MARIRTIKPEFFRSEDVSALPLRARLTWIGLWTHCDDHGRTKDSTRLVKGDVWPLDEVTLSDVEEDLDVLAAHGRIVRYGVDGKRYLAIVNWHVHQAINRPSKPRHPAPPVATGPQDPGENGWCPECGVSTHADSHDTSSTPHGALTPGREGEGKGTGRGNAQHGSLNRPAVDPGSAEPPLRCPKHEGNRNPGPCGACADARREHDAWVRAQRPKPQVTSTPPCPIHPGQPGGRCTECVATAVPPPTSIRNRKPGKATR